MDSSLSSTYVYSETEPQVKQSRLHQLTSGFDFQHEVSHHINCSIVATAIDCIVVELRYETDGQTDGRTDRSVAQCPHRGREAVSYTHLTLPTILRV